MLAQSVAEAFGTRSVKGWLARACVKSGWHVHVLRLIGTCVGRVFGTCVCEEWLARVFDDV